MGVLRGAATSAAFLPKPLEERSWSRIRAMSRRSGSWSSRVPGASVAAPRD